jgi:hypothetical protein
MVTTITGTSISTANLNLGGTFMSDELAKYSSNNYMQSVTASLGGSYKIGKVVAEYNSSGRSNASNAAWVEWPAAGFTNHTGFTGGSTIYIEAWIPMRNDSSSWGGGYVDTNITFDNGVAWRSLGNHGYDGGVMASGTTYVIHGENITYLVTGTPSTDYSVKLRFMFKSYDGTISINSSHDINRTGTAGFCPAGTDGIADTRLGGTDSNQSWGSYRIIEYIPT